MNPKFEMFNERDLPTIVACCLADPTYQHDPLTLAAGEWAVNQTIFPGSHQCYWNCRFAAAVACNFPLAVKRRAAHFVIWNGQTGYFEIETHGGYKMEPIFKLAGIDFNPDQTYRLRAGTAKMYYHLTDEAVSALRKIFNLPHCAPEPDLKFYTSR